MRGAAPIDASSLSRSEKRHIAMEYLANED